MNTLPGSYAVWPDLTNESLDVINGSVFGSEIWDEVCMTGGWCTIANVFVAWDKMVARMNGNICPAIMTWNVTDRRRAMVAANAPGYGRMCGSDALGYVVDDINVTGLKQSSHLRLTKICMVSSAGWKKVATHWTFTPRSYFVCFNGKRTNMMPNWYGIPEWCLNDPMLQL